MAAKKKSASRRSAAKAKSKKAGKRPAAKKGAAKKAVSKRTPARKKVAAPRRKSAAKAARTVQRPALPSPALAEIDQRIALVRSNLRDLMEQAASTSGSASEEALSDRIIGQEAELQRLRQERDALVKSEGA
jgi:hypothetical protein